MKKKKNQNLRNNQNNRGDEPTPDFENRRYITSNYVASPSAKGRGDQIFRKTVSALQMAIPDNHQISKQKKIKTKAKMYQQKKSKTSRGYDQSIQISKITSDQKQKQPQLTHQNLIMQSELQRYSPDSGCGIKSPSHSNMIKSIYQEKKILFSKSSIQVDKHQQQNPTTKQFSRSNAHLKKDRTERRAKRDNESN